VTPITQGSCDGGGNGDKPCCYIRFIFAHNLITQTAPIVFIDEINRSTENDAPGLTKLRNINNFSMRQLAVDIFYATLYEALLFLRRMVLCVLSQITVAASLSDRFYNTRPILSLEST
jgi:hypothetical protein